MAFGLGKPSPGQKLPILAYVRRLIKQLFGHSLSTPLPLGVLIQKRHIQGGMVQRRSIRWICNSYSNYDSVTGMQSDLCLRSLEQRQVDASVIMLYKIIHGSVAISLPVYFEQLSRQTRHSHPLAFRQIHTTANYYIYSCFPLSIVYWNRLPAEVVMLPTLDQFSVAVRSLDHRLP